MPGQDGVLPDRLKRVRFNLALATSVHNAGFTIRRLEQLSARF